MSAVERTVSEILAEGRIPSVSVVVRVDGVERIHGTWGAARREPWRPAASDQAYDLASVTKALAGATVAASLIADGRLAIDQPVATVLDGFDRRVTVRHLLQHTSGLPAWAPLYERIGAPWGTPAARRAVIDLARHTPLVADPGALPCYSDLGFLVLLDVLEAVGGAPIDELLRERILRPLGVEDLRYGWPGAAATEDCPVRGGVVEGTVHDLNCAAMGGVSTHAGLFGTARAVAAVGEAIVDAIVADRGPLPGAVLRAFASARGPGSHRLGFDGISGPYTSTGRSFPADTIGHLGYTGTSLWIVPSRRAVVAVLTNRVHPTDDKASIREARPRIHDAVAADLGWDKVAG